MRGFISPLPPLDPAAFLIVHIPLQRQVFFQRKIVNGAQLSDVSWQIRHARPQPIPDGSAADVLAIQFDSAAHHFFCADQRGPHRVPAGIGSSQQTEDFSGTYFKRHVMGRVVGAVLVPHRQAAGFQHDAADGDFLFLRCLRGIFATHQTKEILCCRFARAIGFGRPSRTKERRFNKSTFTASVLLRGEWKKHELQGGLSGEFQHNRRGGWGFIIPDFETGSFGLYLCDRYVLRENLVLNAGVRYDYAQTHIRSYSDWFETPVGDVPTYKERSADMRRHFNSFTWSAGVNYAKRHWLVKANVGKSFRVPIPKELGADGINYHIFRYERGNPDLNPEESYQVDATIGWNNGVVEFQVEPYLNYFPNYIYLNPTPRYVEGLQLYHYTQARVLRCGLEAQAAWHFLKHWELNAQGEYLYARQKSGEKKGYTLPFSTPWSVDAGLKYSFDWKGEGFVSLNAHIVGRQDEIVPPEKPTPGYWTLNLSAGKYFMLWRTKLSLAFHADNLLNRRYYDHTSYYRLIDVPEPGRNFSMKLGLEF